jgi:hypothetical protein
MICQQVTLSGYAEWPKVADAVIEADLATPLDAQAGAEVQTRLASRLSPHLVGPLHRDAVEVPPRADRPHWGNRPFITRPSTKSLPNGPMTGHSGRHSSPVCDIWRPSNTSTPASSMATGPIPWPKKGRWHWLLGVQTPAGGESHRDYGQPWRRLSACPCGSRQ